MPWVVGVLALLVAAIPIVLFSAGDELFGSSRTTIDAYNRETLASCPTPEGSTLVQASTAVASDDAGRRYRGMSFVYASPSTPGAVGTFFGVDVDRSELVSVHRACRYEHRPEVLVVPAMDTSASTDVVREPGESDLWAQGTAEITMSDEIPVGTRSFFRLRVAQRESDGIF